MGNRIRRLLTRMQWSILYRIRKRALYHRLYFRCHGKRHADNGIRLHLGCGHNYLHGWINIDTSNQVKADLYMDLQNIGKYSRENSVDEIQMIHVISYLRYWEAVDFFKDCYRILKNGGKLILESPDICKLATALASIGSLDTSKDRVMYLEAVRAFYAFDMEQIKKKNAFQTYRFGWSAMHLQLELKKIGFQDIKTLAPQHHGALSRRDLRIEATK